MASHVKLTGTDIKSKQKKDILENLVKYAFSMIITKSNYKEKLVKDGVPIGELIKTSEFRQDFIHLLGNQLIRGRMDHFVAVFAQELVLSVKYSRGSMMKFNILGFSLIVYEVPYISVPTLQDQDMVKDKEIEELINKISNKKSIEIEDSKQKNNENKEQDSSEEQKITTIISDNENMINIKVDQEYFGDETYEKYKDKITKGLQETIIWFQNAKKDDKRTQNLSSVLLSRFYNQCTDFQWHIIFGKIGDEGSKQGNIITNHQMRLKREKDSLEPQKPILLNLFMRFTVLFQMFSENKNKMTQKKVKLIIFNQKNNPLTSIEEVFGDVKTLNIKSFFSTSFLAILAFLCIFGVFYINKGLCRGYVDNEQVTDKLNSPNDIYMEKIVQEEVEEKSEQSYLEQLCRYKGSFMTNLAVAFIILTVIRQVIIRIQAKRDRV